MLLQTNSYVVPKDKRNEHARLVRRFRQSLAKLGCEHFEVYEQVSQNWGGQDSGGRFVQIMRFRDRRHQLDVQNAERSDPAAQALIQEFCELINFPFQQQQGLFAVGFYSSVLPASTSRETEGASEEAVPSADGAGPVPASPASASAPEASRAVPAGSMPASPKSAPQPEPVEDAGLTNRPSVAPIFFESTSAEPLVPAGPLSTDDELDWKLTDPSDSHVLNLSDSSASEVSLPLGDIPNELEVGDSALAAQPEDAPDSSAQLKSEETLVEAMSKPLAPSAGLRLVNDDLDLTDLDSSEVESVFPDPASAPHEPGLSDFAVATEPADSHDSTAPLEVVSTTPDPASTPTAFEVSFAEVELSNEAQAASDILMETAEPHDAAALLEHADLHLSDDAPEQQDHLEGHDDVEPQAMADRPPVHHPMTHSHVRLAAEDLTEDHAEDSDVELFEPEEPVSPFGN